MTSLLLNLAMVDASLWALPLDLPLILPSMSDAEFDQFSRINRDLRIERNSIGEIIVMSPTFSDTGNRNLKISAQVFNWAEIDGTGEVFDSSTGFTLPNGAIRSPDTGWIQSSRWNALSPEEQASFAPIVPDFVIELYSSSDTLTSLQEKMQEYIQQGVRLGLLIDRKNFNVYVYRPNLAFELLKNPELVNYLPELSGFGLKMKKIW